MYAANGGTVTATTRSGDIAEHWPTPRPCRLSRTGRNSAPGYNARRERARRQRIKPHDAFPVPAISNDRTASGGTAFRIGLAVEDVKERDRHFVTPGLDDPMRRLGCVGANEASAVEEPDVLIAAIASPTVPVAGVEAQVRSPHTSRDLSVLGWAPLVDECFGPDQGRILASRSSQRKDQGRANRYRASAYPQHAEKVATA